MVRCWWGNWSVDVLSVCFFLRFENIPHPETAQDPDVVMFTYPIEYTCALDESVATTWNIPPVIGTQNQPHIIKFFPTKKVPGVKTAGQTRLALTLATSTMLLDAGAQIVCTPQPCTNIDGNSLLLTELEVTHNCYENAVMKRGVRAGTSCTAECRCNSCRLGPPVSSRHSRSISLSSFSFMNIRANSSLCCTPQYCVYAAALHQQECINGNCYEKVTHQQVSHRVTPTLFVRALAGVTLASGVV